MAKAATSTRAPRGTKTLTQAFFGAADAIPEAQRAAVVKATLTAIRNELKADREKAAAAKAKAKSASLAKKAVAKPGKKAAKMAASIKAGPAKIGRPVGSKNKSKGVEAPVVVAEEATQKATGPKAKAPKQAPAEKLAA
jgi:hypothetical protein